MCIDFRPTIKRKGLAVTTKALEGWLARQSLTIRNGQQEDCTYGSGRESCYDLEVEIVLYHESISYPRAYEMYNILS